jgi:hypothetical protein
MAAARSSSREPAPKLVCSPPTVAMAMLNRVSAVASLTGLSPVRMAVARRGMPSSRPCVTVVMVSGGASTAPSTQAAATPIEGSSQLDSSPSAPVVSTTSRTPRSMIERRFCPKALNDAPRAAE